MSEVLCPVCNQQRRVIGALCRECANELRGARLTPEQIAVRATVPAKGGLIDMFGRVHRLAPSSTIGRTVEGDGLVIADSSISRKHARIVETESGWHLRDLDSANGTFVEGSQVKGELELHDGDRVSFATFAMFFVTEAPEVALYDPALFSYTERLVAGTTTRRIEREMLALPLVDVRLEEPSGGGGGVVTIDGKQLQLTVPQFELLSMLIARSRDERGRAEDDRGFVAVEELVSRLSLDSSLPREDHVRQLVRRLRRALAKSGIENLIETRYGVGYRFRGTPRGG